MDSKVEFAARLPRDVKSFLEREATRNCSSQNSEIVRSIRLRMDRELLPDRVVVD
ncbi:DNA-binding protein [Bradyrhizobium elkanii]|uniref:DNA-binding protein n=1 Tax=Bradyrhizobium elkanii TaxID=29448 RepID=UPI002225F0C9|nr:DNA-binding protein [Bradyrhizobium elkanii]MCW2227213.1 hypothetical protein [Bradyrhizobium elkanii]WLB77315.1 DNA-binding protein [Bradyrhizobium elkanii]